MLNRDIILDNLVRGKQAYFELGMSKEGELPVIKFSRGISNTEIRTILRASQSALKWNKNQQGQWVSSDFPRPYTTEAINWMGLRPLDPYVCLGFEYIAYWIFADPVKIDGFADTAYCCYLLSEIPIQPTYILYYAKNLGFPSDDSISKHKWQITTW